MRYERTAPNNATTLFSYQEHIEYSFIEINRPGGNYPIESVALDDRAHVLPVQLPCDSNNVINVIHLVVERGGHVEREY